MGTMHFDAEAKAKAELHSEAVKLITRYESPLEIEKALMAYNCEMESQILAIAHRHPGIVSIGYDDTPPVGGVTPWTSAAIAGNEQVQGGSHRHTLAFRQPAHHASHCEQNQRSPRAGFTRVAE
ncbi:hypothetical protein [Mesorhizobium qingshengii]|uniref:Uncharacterized protein n=1 Tax=Mesorhizobium qingshengii TaxID=1165689 RepID=A0A1G5ZCY1_9HYPH|nr:hypothetical protein [Mesorhizobium qingshengii]SDA92436.1 hypothetical protein SAMN02927914_04724 [Mesorhizobium qingshengii]